MANDDQITARGGLLPVQFPYGNYRRTLYKLTTSATAAVFIGQPMDLDANGGVVPCGITNRSPVLGPVLGFVDTNKAGLPSSMTALDQGGYLPANKDAWCFIADDPNQLFQIQEDTGGSALTQSSVGNTAAMVPRTSSGSTLTGQSTFELDRSSIVGTESGQLQVLGLIDQIQSDGTSNAFGDYSKLMVRINWHRLSDRINLAI